MEHLERYTLNYGDESLGEPAEMWPHPKGDYLEYDDVKRVLDKLAEAIYEGAPDDELLGLVAYITGKEGVE